MFSATRYGILVSITRLVVVGIWTSLIPYYGGLFPDMSLSVGSWEDPVIFIIRFPSQLLILVSSVTYEGLSFFHRGDTCMLSRIPHDLTPMFCRLCNRRKPMMCASSPCMYRGKKWVSVQKLILNIIMFFVLMLAKMRSHVINLGIGLGSWGFFLNRTCDVGWR